MVDKQKEDLSESIVKNTFWNFLFNIVNRFGGLVFTIVLARLLLPELFGLYSLALGFILLLLGLIEYSINTTTIKYISEELGKNHKLKARAYFKFFLTLKVVFAGFLTLSLFLFARPISNYIFHKPLLILPLQIGAIYLFFNAILASFLYLAYSLKRIKYVAISETIFQVSRLVFLVLFLNLFKHGAESVFVALITATVFALGFLFLVISKKYNFLLRGQSVNIDKKRLLKFLFFIAIAGIFNSFFVHIDIVMIGALLPQVAIVGFYQLALNITTGVAALMIFSQVSFPVFTQLKGKKLAVMFSRFLYYSSVLSFPSALGLAFIAKPFIIYIFGAEYVSSIIPIFFLSFVVIEMATGIFFSAIFIAKGKPQYIAKFTVFASILSIALNYILIKGFGAIKPIYGAIGAAIATLISRYFYTVSLAFITNKKLGVKFNLKIFYKPLLSSLIMILFLRLVTIFTPVSLIFGFIDILVAILVYFTTMWLMKGITKEDLRFLRSMVFKNKDKVAFINSGHSL